MFWRKPLNAFTPQEWEAVCDHCGRCCLVQLEDEDGGERVFTHFVCRFHDTQSERCTEYAERTRYVPHCLRLTPENIATLHWMPRTCSYRVLHETGDLPTWHPLRAGSRDRMIELGIPIGNRCVSELAVQREQDWFDGIVRWVE